MSAGPTQSQREALEARVEALRKEVEERAGTVVDPAVHQSLLNTLPRVTRWRWSRGAVRVGAILANTMLAAVHFRTAAHADPSNLPRILVMLIPTFSFMWLCARDRSKAREQLDRMKSLAPGRAAEMVVDETPLQLEGFRGGRDSEGSEAKRLEAQLRYLEGQLEMIEHRASQEPALLSAMQDATPSGITASLALTIPIFAVLGLVLGLVLSPVLAASTPIFFLLVAHVLWPLSMLPLELHWEGFRPRSDPKLHELVYQAFGAGSLPIKPKPPARRVRARVDDAFDTEFPDDEVEEEERSRPLHK